LDKTTHMSVISFLITCLCLSEVRQLLLCLLNLKKIKLNFIWLFLLPLKEIKTKVESFKSRIQIYKDKKYQEVNE